MRRRTRRQAKHWSAVNDVLTGVLKRVAPIDELAVYRVWGFWNEEVGGRIAANAQPTHIRNGALMVTVASHAWIQDLQFLKPNLLKKLNARLGKPLIRDIVFSVGKVAPLEFEGAAPPPAILQGEEISPIPSIDNPDIADAFQRVLAARSRRIATKPRA